METNSSLVAPSRRRALEIEALNECVASGQISAQQIEAHRIAGDFEPFFAQPECTAYRSSQVASPCVCGSWPGGECLKCQWTPAIAQPEQPTLPSCYSDDAVAFIEKHLVLRSYPANSHNAARAGWDAACDFLENIAQPKDKP